MTDVWDVYQISIHYHEVTESGQKIRESIEHRCRRSNPDTTEIITSNYSNYTVAKSTPRYDSLSCSLDDTVLPPSGCITPAVLGSDASSGVTTFHCAEGVTSIQLDSLILRGVGLQLIFSRNFLEMRTATQRIDNPSCR
jgi:hypothetical protein